MELLPKYYADNAEMLDITNAELPEIDRLWEALGRLLLNQFIKTADIHRIREWERLLRIRPDTTAQNLEQRREIILLRLQMRPPLTRRWFEGFLAERFGADNYELGIIHSDYTMNLEVAHSDIIILNELVRILRHLIPITLILNATTNIKVEVQSEPIAIGAAVTSVKHYTITQDFNATINPQAQIGIGSTMAQTKHITVSNAFNATLTAEVKTGVGGSVVKVTNYKI